MRVPASVVAALTVATGCGPAIPGAETPEPVPVAFVDADPLLLIARRTETATEITEIDAGEMLARARAMEEDGRCGDAVAQYDEIARRFAATTAEAEALYRKGVCLESLGDWAGALLAFRARLDLAGGAVGDAEVPALIHAAILEESLMRWSEAEASYRRLAEVPTLEPGDRRAAKMRLAAVLDETGDDESSRALMLEVIGDTMTAIGMGEEVHPAPAAEAHFRLGVMAADDMRGVALDASETREARRQMETKASRFSDAFGQFVAAIRSGSPWWAVASGYEAGRMYLDVYDALIDAPLPAELADDQRETYEAFVRARTRILLANALSAWEENLVRAERSGVRGGPVDASAEGVETVRRIVEELEAGRTEMDDEALEYVRSLGEEDPLGPFTRPPDIGTGNR